MKQNPIVVSVSMVLSALSSIAEAANSASPLPFQSQDVDAVMLATVQHALGSRPAQEFIGQHAGVLVNGITLDGQKLNFDPGRNMVADYDDSTGTVDCYSNCYSACYAACHSSRGWR